MIYALVILSALAVSSGQGRQNGRKERKSPLPKKEGTTDSSTCFGPIIVRRFDAIRKKDKSPQKQDLTLVSNFHHVN